VNGLPIGMMLVDRHFDEATLIRADHAFEQTGDSHKRGGGVIADPLSQAHIFRDQRRVVESGGCPFCMMSTCESPT